MTSTLSGAAHDAAQIEILHREFFDVCATYLPSATRERLQTAFEFAKTAHAGQYRKSGEPFITHPLTVALYMAKLYVDESLLIGALLHDVAEDTAYTLEDIERQFGAQTCHLVNGVTHLKNVSHLEDIAHLFLAMSSDVRVVLIKLFDRLHNMRTLDAVAPERRRRKALETLRIYVPLAAKLGMWHLKTEFETLILSYLAPEIYQQICDGLDERYQTEYPKLDAIARDIQRTLRARKIPCGVRVHRRSPYRIYESMRGHQLDAHAFNKAFQIVILVDSLPECYLALGYVHERYPHVADSLVDTIGNPRDIFYRSLHTQIIVPDYANPVHLRIRTYDFDRLSELGILAEIQFATPEEEKQPHKAPWLPKLPELYNESENAQKFVESVFQDILQKQLTCFTPRGAEITLPRGATVLDFAYHVHTDIGHECRGAIVNNRPAEINQQLADGDKVEIIRSRRAEPYHEWLDETLGYVTTSRAKRKIREFFKRQSHETQVRKGRELLREEKRRFNVDQVTSMMLMQDFDLESIEDLYLHIGNGSISVSDLARAILTHVPDLIEHTHRDYVEIHDSEGMRGWLEPFGGRELRLASCCEPRIGEDIVTHIRQNNNIALVHRANCRYIIRSKRPDNLLRMKWLKTIDPLLMIHLRLEGYDRGGLLRDVSIPIAELGANIIKADSAIDDKHIVIRLKVEAENQDDIIRIIHRLASLQNITRLQRMDKRE
ncbi:MAG: RelA/SpoT family protein, partial [Anaerolineales bacterium]